jgi:hypothetical protein
MRQVKAKELPGDLFGPAVIITCIYIMEAMAMQVCLSLSIVTDLRVRAALLSNPW